jgi:hypothetical protein
MTFWLMRCSGWSGGTWPAGRSFLPSTCAVAVLGPGLVLDGDLVARDLDDARRLGHDHVAGVAGGAGLDAGADVGGLGHDQRHGLLLHVGAHQGPVGVVVLDEGDQAVETDTICFGETSMRSTSAGGTKSISEVVP